MIEGKTRGAKRHTKHSVREAAEPARQRAPPPHHGGCHGHGSPSFAGLFRLLRGSLFFHTIFFQFYATVLPLKRMYLAAF